MRAEAGEPVGAASRSPTVERAQAVEAVVIAMSAAGWASRSAIWASTPSGQPRNGMNEVTNAQYMPMPLIVLHSRRDVARLAGQPKGVAELADDRRSGGAGPGEVPTREGAAAPLGQRGERGHLGVDGPELPSW